MTKGEDTYFFIKNLQGDITKIIDENGTTAATYAYDAWGKIITENEDSSIEGLNPFRYRGYVYDPETELYYLQSRYYDPITGRFLNLDNPEFSDTGSGSPLSTNMFAYCENNAVNGYDPSGMAAYLLQNNNAIRFYNKIKILEYISIYNLDSIKDMALNITKKMYMGHTSLLIQENTYRWWYFYWGDKKKQLVLVDVSSPTNLKQLNSFLKDKGYLGGNYNDKIEFKGNFLESLKYIYKTLFGKKSLKNYNKKNEEYNAINNNCVQVSLKVLYKGTFNLYNSDIKTFLNFSKKKHIPNIVFYGIKRFFLISKNYGMGYAMAHYQDVFKFTDVFI